MTRLPMNLRGIFFAVYLVVAVGALLSLFELVSMKIDRSR